MPLRSCAWRVHAACTPAWLPRGHRYSAALMLLGALLLSAVAAAAGLEGGGGLQRAARQNLRSTAAAAAAAEHGGGGSARQLLMGNGCSSCDSCTGTSCSSCSFTDVEGYCFGSGYSGSCSGCQSCDATSCSFCASSTCSYDSSGMAIGLAVTFGVLGLIGVGLCLWFCARRRMLARSQAPESVAAASAEMATGYMYPDARYPDSLYTAAGNAQSVYTPPGATLGFPSYYAAPPASEPVTGYPAELPLGGLGGGCELPVVPGYPAAAPLPPQPPAEGGVGSNSCGPMPGYPVGPTW